ncbi:cellulose biosynthesis cyclic di-GMP-binding regulatory protein BcsB [Corynebacterium deserti]|uniref:cellulose biosynthesis cyclic di-GMP-binding regulatory protein BcsB n=1 Tax=Corynebacterium deserti TaxID=1408191 RepID=UPI001E57EFC6|nr:cellulose biosynthesis cyclic di-GMP-binding regulatory protein BcsB [Corynebacterium deserti]
MSTALSTSLLLGITPPVLGATINPSMPLSALRSSDDIAVPNFAKELPLSFDVPAGTVPQSLSGTLQIPAEFSGGVVEFYDGDRLFHTLRLEVNDSRAYLEVPLQSIPVEDGRANFSLRAILDPVNNQWCYEEQEVRFLDGNVTFEGATINPAVVADYFPSVLRALTIYVPENPSGAVQEATLEVATSLDSVYRRSGLDVNVETLPTGSDGPATAPGDFERQIVLVDEVTERNTQKTELVNPGQDNAFLRLSGNADELYDQARLLTDATLPLAVDTEVTASGFGDVPNLSTDVATLQELGITQLTSESIARTSVTLGIERSRLRTYSQYMDLHITGTYTPLPPQNAGQITFSVGDTVLDSFTTDDTGIIDREFNVPGDLVNRYTEIVVEFTSTGDVNCEVTQPVGLNIDSDSLVTSQHSDVPVLNGFRSLPQSFQPRVDVAFADPSVQELSRAVSVVLGIQSMSSQRIRPHLVDWDEAVASERPTIFIDAAGAKTDQVPSYLAQQGPTLEITSKNDQNADGEQLTRSLQTNAALVVGSIQAVWDADKKRTVIVASSQDSPAELDALISWMGEDRERWSDLNGDLIVKVRDREPVQLTTVEAPDQPGRSATVFIAIGVSLVVIALIVAAVVSVSRRSQKGYK